MTSPELQPAQLSSVQKNARFDKPALAAYLRREIGRFSGDIVLQQFLGGQSNPTYKVQAGTHTFVLRKRPSGVLLPSAHAIDREYRVMEALHSVGIPVPHMRSYCADTNVIGQSFYVMDHVDGRVYHDRRLPGCTPAERRAMYESMVKNLARLSLVDPFDIGLGDFGRSTGYISRQVTRWSKQYIACALPPCPTMEWLMSWLSAHAPPDGKPGLIHGDYRIGNLMFHPTRPEVVAILDWELSTIGDPLADLAYGVFRYFVPGSVGGGLSDVDLVALGIPNYDKYMALYRHFTGVEIDPDSFTYLMVFSMFRSAAIAAGVYRRALDGNAADPTAHEKGRGYSDIAEHAKRMVHGGWR